MKIVIDNKIPFIKGVFEPFAEVLYISGSEIKKEQVIDADALIVRTRTACNEELLNRTCVKFIATATIGYDHIDTNYCFENGIIWKNAPGCNSGSVMQYIASALASLALKYNFNFEDRTLGVVGVGNVGKKIVRLGEALGMRVVLNDPPVMRRGACGLISLEGILRESDIISIHTPLNYEGEDKSYHLFNESILNKVNPGTILINSSRGEVVETEAVKKVFKSGKLQSVILDVWENEPDIDPELLAMCDFSTSHIAGYSQDGKANATMMSVRAISSFFRLGLENWKPTHIPEPENEIIEIDAENDQQAFIQAILHTYNIENDSFYLKRNPSQFENYRNNYPRRREFQAFKIKLKNPNSSLTHNLRQLGFNIV